MAKLTETRALRAPLPTAKAVEYLRCSEIKGFGVALYKTGVRSYIVEFPNSGGRITLGRVGVLAFESPDRDGARDLAIAALNARRFGKDAKEAVGLKKQPKGMTLNEVWEAFEKAGYPMLRGEGRQAATTAKGGADRWKKHMADSKLGKTPIGEVTNAKIQKWADGIATDGQRAHCVTQVKSIVGYAATRGLGHAAEPITIKAGKSREMQNFYSASDLIAIDEAAIALIAEQPHRIGVFSALRLLLHTGARTGEILSLRWQDIDAARQVIALKKHKGDRSGKGKDIHLTDAAIAIIASMPQLAGSPWVFPAESKSGHLTTLQKAWRDLIEAAGVVRHRRHDLRHSFVSTAIANGVSLYVAGKLVGHQQATTTQRYAHLEADAAKAAIGKIGSAIAPKRPRAA